MTKTFTERVHDVVRNIKMGETMTYKQVAEYAGRARAFRAVGNILNKNFDPTIPCHRVVRSDGATGGYNRGATQKKALLKKEGALIVTIALLTMLVPHDLHAKPNDPEYVREPHVQLWTHDAKHIRTFTTLPDDAKGGGFVATGDVNGDGNDELVVGAGMGSEPDVRIFSSDGSLLYSFFAYGRGFRGGIRVAVGDLDGDGKDEIVTAPGPGGGPHIRIFDDHGKERATANAMAYAPAFIGGVHITTADLDGDGRDEIITAPGPGGGPHIRIFDGNMNNRGWDFFAYDANMSDGVTLTAIRAPEGESLVTAIESWHAPIVSTWLLRNGSLEIKTEFLAYDETAKSGVRVSAFDIDNDGRDEIVSSPNGGAFPETRITDRWGTLIVPHRFQDTAYRGGMSLAQLDANGDGRNDLVAMPSAPVIHGPVNADKTIVIDISEQRLYAYEHGRLARSFLISSGLRSHPTPENWSTTVKAKIPVKDYKWTYGTNHPDNYHLKNVKYNLSLGGPYYIHHAYWHNNFGRRMSHGCVNVGLHDSEWIYTWASVGTSVQTIP